ncbi:30S ribosomal protein S1 [Helicobacter japonicus]|uniref:30S ribosomal protein S1 n=5 Tax=Helicobacter japonicus TaxID=425400 RepID=A0A4U8TPX6_9HELI|nr:30S ribosomal protein S1 [Helicobacter japonicus]TLE01885.1 30S ribosomal protein S1 [Helicobacter japonicus]
MLVNLCDAVEGEEEFVSLLQASENRVIEGAIQNGEIVEIGDEYAMVAIANEKREAKLRVSEITDKDGNVLFKKNDKIEVFVSPSRQGPIASYVKAQKMKRVAEKIAQLADDYKDKVIEAKVIKKNKGGYIMEYDGIDVFMPRRDSAIREDSKVAGKTYKVAIIKIDKENNSIIVSRKRFFEIDDEKRKEISNKLLANNAVQKGIVTKIAPFGIFVDVEGIEGLVHYTELSHKGPINPEKKFKLGDKVEVKVLGFDEKKRRLSLSMKALSDDPWTEIEKELEVGYAIKVSVSNIESYGAFVDLGNDIEGFLHISEISWDKNIKHPSRYLKEGQEIDVEIIEIDTKNRRLRVSLKKLLEKPFAQFIKAYQVGSIIKGKVATLTDFGAFIKLGSVDGLLHNEDAYWDKNIKCKDKLKEGDEIEVKIIKIDKENEKISLSQKALLRSPAKEFAQKHKVDEIVKGKVIDIKDFGIFVKIDEMEALIRNEDIYPLKKEEIKLDEEISCVIAHIDEENNKVRASVKKLERQKEKEALKAFSNSEEKMTLGDKLKNRL